jgi:phage protein D
VFEFGKAVEVLSPGGASLFKGLVFAIGDEFAAGTAPRARLVAADRLERLSATRRSRSFSSTTDSELIQRLAGEHGLLASVNLTTPVRPSVSQLDCSDLDFLCQIAARCDARLRLDDTRLIVQRFDNVDLPPLTFMLGQDLQSFAVSADLRGQPTSVSVGGWSAAAGSAVSAGATPIAADFDVPGGDSGASIGQSALGAAPYTQASPSAGSSDEAAAQARALMATRARRFVSASGRLGSLAEGLHAGSVVMLAGLGPLHSGRYRITMLRRRFDTAQGPYTEFEAQRNSIGRP